jgi:DNA mismatch endonuclease (patch repair protein)
MDTLSPVQRSERMSRVRSRDSKPELRVRRLVHGMGFRFRLHRADLPGCPDLVLPRCQKVILVHGCFWHRHRGCPRTRLPKSRVDFWRNKFETNVKRDKAVRRALRREGWKVLVVWECETESPAKVERKVARFLAGAA